MDDRILVNFGGVGFAKLPRGTLHPGVGSDLDANAETGGFLHENTRTIDIRQVAPLLFRGFTGIAGLRHK